MNRLSVAVLAAIVASCAAPIAAPVVIAPSPAVAEGPTAAQLVQARQAGMHMAATLLYQGIVPRSKGSGALKDVHYSEGIEMWAAAIPGLFPAGSNHPQSRALPAIWADKPDFDRKAAELARSYTAYFPHNRNLGQMVRDIDDYPGVHPCAGVRDRMDRLNSATSDNHHGDDADATPKKGVDPDALKVIVVDALELIGARRPLIGSLAPAANSSSTPSVSPTAAVAP